MIYGIDSIRYELIDLLAYYVCLWGESWLGMETC